MYLFELHNSRVPITQMKLIRVPISMNYCYGKMKNIVSSKVKISNVIFIVCTIEENCNDEEYLITKVGERDQLQF